MRATKKSEHPSANEYLNEESIIIQTKRGRLRLLVALFSSQWQTLPKECKEQAPRFLQSADRPPGIY